MDFLILYCRSFVFHKYVLSFINSINWFSKSEVHTNLTAVIFNFNVTVTRDKHNTSLKDDFDWKLKSRRKVRHLFTPTVCSTNCWLLIVIVSIQKVLSDILKIYNYYQLSTIIDCSCWYFVQSDTAFII